MNDTEEGSGSRRMIETEKQEQKATSEEARELNELAQELYRQNIEKGLPRGEAFNTALTEALVKKFPNAFTAHGIAGEKVYSLRLPNIGHVCAIHNIPWWRTSEGPLFFTKDGVVGMERWAKQYPIPDLDPDSLPNTIAAFKKEGEMEVPNNYRWRGFMYYTRKGVTISVANLAKVIPPVREALGKLLQIAEKRGGNLGKEPLADFSNILDQILQGAKKFES